MSLAHLRRPSWYQRRPQRQTIRDSQATTPACGGCQPDLAPLLTDWSEL